VKISPWRASASTHTRFAMPSLSTSTPSQSKITKSYKLEGTRQSTAAAQMEREWGNGTLPIAFLGSLEG